MSFLGMALACAGVVVGAFHPQVGFGLIVLGAAQTLEVYFAQRVRLTAEEAGQILTAGDRPLSDALDGKLRRIEETAR